MILTSSQETEAMDVSVKDAPRKTADLLMSPLSMRIKTAVIRVCTASVYTLETTVRELTTAQAFFLTMFEVLLAENTSICSMLLHLASTIEQLKSPYLEVWLREDFNFDRTEVKKVLTALECSGLEMPEHIIKVFIGLMAKYDTMELSEGTSSPDLTQGLSESSSSPKALILTESTSPELDAPFQTELVITKRCLGLPKDTSRVDVRYAACRKDADGYNLLHRLSEAGHTVGVEELLTLGLKWDQRGPGATTPVHAAAENGHVGVLECLMKAGADLGIVRDDGCTPILLAAADGHTEAVMWLADHGVDISATNSKGQTALHLAAAGGHTGVLRILLDLLIEQKKNEAARLGAVPRNLGTVDPRDCEGLTPLHLAARANMVESLELLVMRGANLGALTSEGMTPLNEATLWGANEAERVIVDLGGGIKKKGSKGTKGAKGKRR